MAALVTYQYTYGAGADPNRKLAFQENNGRITAIVEAYGKEGWKKISEVSEDQMSVEGASTTEKMQIMMDARKLNSTPIYPENKRLSQLEKEKKINILTHLAPTGEWRITIINDIGKNPRFETVSSLNFYRAV